MHVAHHGDLPEQARFVPLHPGQTINHRRVVGRFACKTMDFPRADPFRERSHLGFAPFIQPDNGASKSAAIAVQRNKCFSLIGDGDRGNSPGTHLAGDLTQCCARGLPPVVRVLLVPVRLRREERDGFGGPSHHGSLPVECNRFGGRRAGIEPDHQICQRLFGSRFQEDRQSSVIIAFITPSRRSATRSKARGVSSRLKWWLAIASRLIRRRCNKSTAFSVQ